MADRTDYGTATAHGQNPQYLFSKILRDRIQDSRYWKETCFALTAESIVDVAIKLKYVSGFTTGFNKPTPFVCLLYVFASQCHGKFHVITFDVVFCLTARLKLCQIGPEKEIIEQYIKQEEFKYLTALGCMYLRMTAKSPEIYKILEPLLADYRKLVYRHTDGSYKMIHIDEFVDDLLTNDHVLNMGLAKLVKRDVLEEQGVLAARYA